MQPTLEIFRSAVEKYHGNLTQVARSFGVVRSTVKNWVNNGGEDWKAVVYDARMRFFDDVLLTSEILAKGIPQRDDEGNIIGWLEKPDGQMIRYILSTLGRKEGFSEDGVEEEKAEASASKEIKINVVYNNAADLELQPKPGSEPKEE